MIRLPTRTTRTDTLVPYTTLVRSDAADRARRRALGLHRQLEAERGDRRAGERIRAAAVVLPAAPRRREALSAGGSVMWSHVARRLAATVPILLGLSVAVFARSEEHTSELQSLMRISYAVFCLKKKKKHN